MVRLAGVACCACVFPADAKEDAVSPSGSCQQLCASCRTRGSSPRHNDSEPVQNPASFANSSQGVDDGLLMLHRRQGFCVGVRMAEGLGWR